MRINLYAATVALLSYAGTAMTFTEQAENLLGDEYNLAQYEDENFEDLDFAQIEDSLKVSSLTNKTPGASCGCCDHKACCKKPCMSHADVKSNIKEVIDKHMKNRSGLNAKCDNAKCKAD